MFTVVAIQVDYREKFTSRVRKEKGEERRRERRGGGGKEESTKEEKKTLESTGI